MRHCCTKTQSLSRPLLSLVTVTGLERMAWSYIMEWSAWVLGKGFSQEGGGHGLGFQGSGHCPRLLEFKEFKLLDNTLRNMV